MSVTWLVLGTRVYTYGSDTFSEVELRLKMSSGSMPPPESGRHPLKVGVHSESRHLKAGAIP